MEVIDRKTKGELARIFKVFDKNGDKKLNYQELQTYLYTIGLNFLNKGFFDDLVSSADPEKEGLVQFKDLITYIEENSQHLFTEQDLSESLKIFDYEKDGRADVEDLMRVLRTYSDMTEPELESLMKLAKPDKNNQIEIQAFIDKIFH